MKTVQLKEKTHMLIINKQLELRRKGIKKEIREIVDEAILAGINSVGKEIVKLQEVDDLED